MLFRYVMRTITNVSWKSLVWTILEVNFERQTGSDIFNVIVVETDSENQILHWDSKSHQSPYKLVNREIL